MELIARRSALELRGRKAPNMQMVLVQSGDRPAIAGDWPTADGAGSTDPVWNRSPRQEAADEHGASIAWLYPPKLAVLAILHTLELPGREAAHVDVKLVQPRLNAVKRELDLKLQLVLRNGLTADPAGRTDPWSAPGTVGSSVWQLSSADHFAGFRAKRRLVRHVEASRIRRMYQSQMPGGPDACSRHPGSPMEGDVSLLDFYGYVTALWFGRGSPTLARVPPLG
jgi:hypothetical protein